MKNNTSNDVISGGAWCNRIVAKQEHCQSSNPADKQTNELLQSTALPSNIERIREGILSA